MKMVVQKSSEAFEITPSKIANAIKNNSIFIVVALLIIAYIWIRV